MKQSWRDGVRRIRRAVYNGRHYGGPNAQSNQKQYNVARKQTGQWALIAKFEGCVCHVTQLGDSLAGLASSYHSWKIL